MADLARGDEAALSALIVRHQARVWRIASGVLGDPEEAKDIAQMAFLRMVEAASGYRPEGRFTAWLRRLVTRLCLDHLRRRWPEPIEGGEHLDTEADPGRVSGSEERHLELRGALLHLPPRQRMALVLRYDEGLGYAEIALALGDDATPKLVERLLERGRKGLARLLQDGER